MNICDRKYIEKSNFLDISKVMLFIFDHISMPHVYVHLFHELFYLR